MKIRYLSAMGNPARLLLKSGSGLVLSSEARLGRMGSGQTRQDRTA